MMSAMTCEVSEKYDKFGLTVFLLQELEDQLQEEEDKVNHLNKVKSKLEQQIDEVGVPLIDINISNFKLFLSGVFLFVC